MPVIFLADTKPFLELSASNTAQDAVIQLLIDGAHEFVERVCGVKFESESREELLDGGVPALQPTIRPITELLRVTDMFSEDESEIPAVLQGRLVLRADDNGNPLLPIAGWEVENYPNGSKLQWWDQGRARFKVEYTGGYDADTIPAGLKTILYQIVSRDYFNRNGAASEASAGASKAWISDADFKKRLAPYNQTQKVIAG